MALESLLAWMTHCILQVGDNASLLETKKKELEVKRAAAASRGAKVFYKVTVKVSDCCMI